jgi:hypothetical protein
MGMDGDCASGACSIWFVTNICVYYGDPKIERKSIFYIIRVKKDITFMTLQY